MGVPPLHQPVPEPAEVDPADEKNMGTCNDPIFRFSMLTYFCLRRVLVVAEAFLA